MKKSALTAIREGVQMIDGYHLRLDVLDTEGEVVAFADMNGRQEAGGTGRLKLHHMTLDFFADLLAIMSEELRNTARPAEQPAVHVEVRTMEGEKIAEWDTTEDGKHHAD